MQMNESQWEDRAKGVLKGEIKRRNLSYNQLVDMLRSIGVEETEPNVRNKIARGKFTAVFFLQCLEAIGVKAIRLNDD